MEIEIRCEQCGKLLTIEKEYTNRDGLKITVNPCDRCMSYWKNHYYEVALGEIEVMNEYD